MNFKEIISEQKILPEMNFTEKLFEVAINLFKAQCGYFKATRLNSLFALTSCDCITKDS